jgi:hypothetical protein
MATIVVVSLVAQKDEIFATTQRSLPEMIASEAVLDAALELPCVRATVRARLRADAVALSAGPLAGVAVAAVEAVDAVAVAEAEPVLAAVPAAARPALDAVPVVLAVHPVALVLALAEEVVDAAAAAPPPVELALVAVPVAVELHALPHLRRPPLLPLLLLAHAAVLTDEPLHGGRRAPPVPDAAEQRDGGGERGHRGGRQEREVVSAALVYQEEQGEREEKQRELGRPGAEPAVGPAKQGQRLRLLVVGLRVVERMERRGRGSHGRRPQQRRRRPRQLTRPPGAAVHCSPPSHGLLLPSQSAPFFALLGESCFLR